MAELQIVYDTPAGLNQAICSGKLDVSPVSSAYYLQHQDELVMLKDLSVSSPGHVESVVLISKTPLDRDFLDQGALGVPDTSATSVQLLAHLMRERTGTDFRPWFKVYPADDYEAALHRWRAVLIIGDNALKALSGEFGEDPYYIYDLAGLWHEETKLPFVFAVWVARKNWAEKYPQRLEQLNQQLCDSRDAFFANSQLLNDGVHLAATQSHLPMPLIHRYFTQCLSFHLAANELASLSRFYDVLTQLDAEHSVAQVRSPLLPCNATQQVPYARPHL